MANYLKLLETLDLNKTILTPNRRLAATLHKLHAEQLSASLSCWETPDILPMTAWLQRLWQDYTSRIFTPYPLLLNATQERYIWEKIIAGAKQSDQLLQVSETAEVARSAWAVLKQWQVDFSSPVFNTADDYAALSQWSATFQTYCQTNAWLDINSLTNIIIELITARQINISKYITLVGFTEISPQQKNLIAACEEVGCHTNQFELVHPTPSAMRISLLDLEAEIFTMARWAKTLYSANKITKIGCVIPGLENIRARVNQIFTEIFFDNSLLDQVNPWPFNISAGKSLLQYPSIFTALQLLNLNKSSIALEVFSYLLASPFLGEAESERISRYKYDRQLRQDNISVLALKDLLNQENQKSIGLWRYSPKLAARLKHFYNEIAEFPKQQTYSGWAHSFTQLLSILGWPGERSLSSEEYQTVEAWLKLLNEFISLDQVDEVVDYQHAFLTLQKLVSKSIFQAQSPEAKIQILGVLEAASIPFDHLWIAGMDDIAWPPQPKPNPFIPKRLQRELQMPHATAERELKFCQTIIHQFLNSANTVIFSHAEKNAEVELLPSPLIRHIPTISLADLGLPDYQSNAEKIFATRIIETFVDETAPPIQAEEKIYGGVSILKNQALCPFKAFAETRLHARDFEQPLLGLRAQDRGSIVHKILELVWSKLKDQKTLLDMSEVELVEFIQTCIDETFILIPPAKTEFTKYILLEKQRLQQLIMDWLRVEKSRPGFIVDTNEKVSQIQIGPLNLSVRIDRVDQLENGTKLIIDYKTSRNTDLNHWFSDRPEEPQLLLYTLVDPKQTSGITFAQVAQGEHGFKGISQHHLDIEGVQLFAESKKVTALSWEQQLNEWHTILTQLSNEFFNGIAKVQPKDALQTCNWCSLQSICRINEESIHDT